MKFEPPLFLAGLAEAQEYVRSLPDAVALKDDRVRDRFDRAVMKAERAIQRAARAWIRLHSVPGVGDEG